MRLLVRLEWLYGGAVGLPVLLAVVGFIYYPLAAQAGLFSPEGDSIGIVLFPLLLAAPVLALILLLYVQPATWRYGDNATLMEGDRRHPWRLALSILFYGVPAAFVLYDVVLICLSGVTSLDGLFLIVDLPLLAWLLMLRAAMSASRLSSADARIA